MWAAGPRRYLTGWPRAKQSGPAVISSWIWHLAGQRQDLCNVGINQTRAVNRRREEKPWGLLAR
jgi:hypothetical protein